jgi:hypothetical protein
MHSAASAAGFNPLDRAAAGASGAELSVLQKKQLCMLARSVFTQQQRRGLAPSTVAGVGDPGSSAALFDRWRYEENFKACHKEHLRACTQADWPLLRAHYLRLQGRRQEARVLETRAATNDVRVAQYKLNQACQEARDVIGDPRAYVGHICITRYQRNLSELTARQLWTLIFDLRRNAQTRRAKIARGEMPLFSVTGMHSKYLADKPHPTDLSDQSHSTEAK